MLIHEERKQLGLTAQQMRIVKALRCKPITPHYAYFKLCVYRLADVILKLRDKGYQIDTERTHGQNEFGEKCSFAKYVLTGEPASPDALFDEAYAGAADAPDATTAEASEPDPDTGDSFMWPPPSGGDA